jgi:hypothetical protein
LKNMKNTQIKYRIFPIQETLETRCSIYLDFMFCTLKKSQQFPQLAAQSHQLAGSQQKPTQIKQFPTPIKHISCLQPLTNNALIYLHFRQQKLADKNMTRNFSFLA